MSQSSALEVAKTAANDKLQELEGRKAELSALLRNLEDTREQLVRRLNEIGGALRDELKLQEEASIGPQGAKARLEELVTAGGNLRQTLSSVDADRSELARVAHSHLEKWQDMQAQCAKLQAARADMQWRLDQLKHARDLQQGWVNFCGSCHRRLQLYFLVVRV